MKTWKGNIQEERFIVKVVIALGVTIRNVGVYGVSLKISTLVISTK